MDSAIGSKAALTTEELIFDVDIISSTTAPLSTKQGIGEKERCLKLIDTVSLRSGSGSRSSPADEGESMSELVSSIASLGIIEPIVVRRAEDDTFVVVAGERRFSAAKLLNLRLVPCVVMRCSDSEALMISLAENLQKSELNPIEIACALRRLLDDFALTQKTIGERVGMAQSTIAHHLRLLFLPLEVQRLISEGALSIGHGKVLASISDEHEAVEAALDCVSKNKSVRELEAWLSSKRGNAVEADERVSCESLRGKREERELSNGVFLVIKESCSETGSGTIEIPYYSPDEKNWLLRTLGDPGTKQKTSQSRARPSAMSLKYRAEGRPSFPPMQSA